MHLELPRGCAAAQVSFTFSLTSSAKYAYILFIGHPPLCAPVTPNWPAVRNACTFIRIANNFKQKLPGTRPSSSWAPFLLPSHRETASATRRPHSQALVQDAHFLLPPSSSASSSWASSSLPARGLGVAARTTTSPLALVNAKSQGWHKCCPSTWPTPGHGPGQ